ncbi:hypothetical protein ACIQNU_39745 [Streptomyces sp. NPDC091292]|uniref:hypothetical protein n=1 Tax=Streptomyces sp. NPDC091292 TaxID=3365991 RepID=UPI0038300CB4
MLAGVGPVPAVLFVVAADEGWKPQSAEHLAAVDALGVRHGLLAVSRCDLADPRPATAQAQDRIRSSTLGGVEAVAVSARTGAGPRGLARRPRPTRRTAAGRGRRLPGAAVDRPVLHRARQRAGGHRHTRCGAPPPGRRPGDRQDRPYCARQGSAGPRRGDRHGAGHRPGRRQPQGSRQGVDGPRRRPAHPRQLPSVPPLRRARPWRNTGRDAAPYRCRPHRLGGHARRRTAAWYGHRPADPADATAAPYR